MHHAGAEAVSKEDDARVFSESQFFGDGGGAGDDAEEKDEEEFHGGEIRDERRESILRFVKSEDR